MKRAIHIYGDPVLRETARAVTSFDAELRKLADDMVETMRVEIGCGLAAQQIGETRSICVVEVTPEHDTDDEGNRLHPELPMPLVLVNPVLSEPSKKLEGQEEGCLSFPGIRGSIPRHREITVTFQDLAGATHTHRVRDFMARVIQHEVDHLNGVLFIDRMSAAKRFALKGRLARLKEEGGESEE